MDAGTGEIAACHLTDNATDDAVQVPVLLELIKDEIASVTVDGAYDGGPVYQAIANYQPYSWPEVVPSAVPGTESAEAQSQRDRHNRLIAGTAGVVSRGPRSADTRRSSARSCAPAAC